VALRNILGPERKYHYNGGKSITRSFIDMWRLPNIILLTISRAQDTERCPARLNTASTHGLQDAVRISRLREEILASEKILCPTDLAS
jgi:hypothetical protein